MMEKYCIISMHRAGSSLITAMLNREHNIELSNDKDAYNVTGYNEAEEIIKINEKLFEELKCTWLGPFKIPDHYVREEYIKKIEDALDKVNLRFIKDPRLLNTISLLGIQKLPVKIILIKRNEKDVLDSIKRRNGFATKDIEKYINTCKKDIEFIEKNYKVISIRYEWLRDKKIISEFFKKNFHTSGGRAIELIEDKRVIYKKQLMQKIRNDLRNLRLTKITYGSMKRRWISYKNLIKAYLNH